MVRKDDFRVSRSGSIIYDKSEIDEWWLKMSFVIAKKFKTKSLILDLVFGVNNNDLIVEIGYDYSIKSLLQMWRVLDWWHEMARWKGFLI